jgi:predicted nucleic acid-binding protein
MPTVSNTSPVSNLAIIGRLAVLRRQFASVMIPEAVAKELARLPHAAGRRQIDIALANGWLVVRKLANRDLADVLGASLDPGESETIALAREIGAGVIVMDESAGRAIAKNLGVGVTGTLGVLLKELRSGGITSMGVEIDRLVDEAGFFISADVRRIFLEAAGEA